ncbi:Transposable element tcb1 transposase [Caligus rogercresseyi]|uniref:Transposable element tcb1 transposase n=1 Tax=Caligus rogercresseyi TaxID=217165 RepID=A0A7T8JVV5_CALRO|nr:Transposable element tcb1 transposase [Caligus rogercresseyi]
MIRATVSKAVKELNIMSYKRNQAHLLTGKMQEVRLGSSKGLLRREKILTVDCSRNCQNDRWLAQTKREVPKTFKTMSPASVMTSSSTSSRLARISTTDVYLGVLKKVVKPWMDEKASGDVYNGSYLFQQDSAPVHKAKNTQETLLTNSPDLNPLDNNMQVGNLPACLKSLQERFEAIIDAEGGHIE